MTEKDTTKSIAPAIKHMVWTDIGNYGGIHSGVEKYYYLMNVIYNLSSHIIVNYGKEYFYEEIEKELTKIKDFVPYKTWENVDRVFKLLQPKLNQIKFLYDDIKGKKEVKKQLKWSKLVKSISPYQYEIHLIFNILMKMSNIQRHTIDRQYFRTLETKEYVKEPFRKVKPKPEEEFR
jgi:hypothetical protein